MIEGSGSVPRTVLTDPEGPKTHGSGPETLPFRYLKTLFFKCNKKVGSGSSWNRTVTNWHHPGSGCIVQEWIRFRGPKEMLTDPEHFFLIQVPVPYSTLHH